MRSTSAPTGFVDVLLLIVLALGVWDLAGALSVFTWWVIDFIVPIKPKEEQEV